MTQALNQNWGKFDLSDEDVYYGSDASWAFMSVSQYKDFLDCEAQALAKLKGDWEPISDPTALLVGNYVHSYFESKEAHEKFKEKNKEALYSKRKPFGLLKAYRVAEEMIKTLEKEPFFNYLWQGEFELPIVGELYGINWKGKIDCLNIEKGYFVDLKTTAKLDTRVWNNEKRRHVSFVEAYGYVLQIAAYEQLLEQQYGKPFTGYIYAVTKEDIPDVAAIEIPVEYKSEALREMSYYSDHIQAVKVGEVEPEACGHCDYCKLGKQLNRFTDVRDLID